MEYLLNNVPGMFSIEHMVLLILCFALIIIFTIKLRKISENNIKHLTLFLAIFVTVAEILKIIYVISKNGIGSLSMWVPLYYCSLYIYALWLSLFKNEFLSRIGKSFIVTGGLFAGTSYLIYPSTSITFYPILHPLVFHAFIYHSLMIFTGLIYIVSEYQKPNFKDFKYYLIFFTFFSILAIIIDYKYKANLMFYYDSYMFPKIATTIENKSKALYTFLIYLGQLLIYFVPTSIYKLINTIRKKKKI